jgi:glycosyltransferase involved in cell wall biosynthesis
LARFYNVLYVEVLQAVSSGEPLEQVTGDIVVCRPPPLSWLVRKLRATVARARRLVDGSTARRVDATIRDLGYRTAVLVNFQFDFPEVMALPTFTSKIYLCNDDFLEGIHRSWQRRMFTQVEHEVIRAADATLAVSLPLVEKLERAGASRAALFLPGHEFDTTGGAVRSRTAPVRVCYMGFMNSRLRVDWLRRLAREPGVVLTLIGPLEGPEQFQDLLSRDNVEHHDTLVGAALENQLKKADVFVMPYDLDQPGVRAITAPNKLFQYLACGRPVVCSNLPRLIELPQGFIYVAADEEQFARAAMTAFDEDTDARAQARRSYASRHTWQARGEALQRVIAQKTVHAGGLS